MQTIVSILAFILALGLIILIHEGGHFFFARRANVLCREYAFGMGPQLLKKKKGETTYALRALPIGGFCAIAGEEVEDDPLKDLEKFALDIQDGVVKRIFVDPKNKEYSNYPEFKHVAHDLFDEANTGNLFITAIKDGEEAEVTYKVDEKAMYVMAKEEIQNAPYNRCLRSKTKSQRAMIMFGGPLMNFVLAIIVFFIAGLIGGSVNNKKSTIGTVGELTPAQVAGVRNSDIVKSFSIDGVEYAINSWDDLTDFMDTYQNKTDYVSNIIYMTVERDGELVKNLSLSPELTAYSIGGVQFCMQEGKVVFDSNCYLHEEDRDAYIESYANMFGEDAMPIGSVITKINGIDATCLQVINNEIQRVVDGSPIVFTVEGGKEYSFTPYSEKLLKTQRTLSGDEYPMSKITIGVSPTYKFSIFKSLGYSFKRTGQSCVMIIDTLGLLFSGKVGVKNLGGVVSIFSLTSSAAKAGFSTLLNWIGLLSVNVGIMNLLPIPALDGGRLVFVAYEAITKKKPSQKVETILITVTMILLFALMAYVTFNDIMRLF